MILAPGEHIEYIDEKLQLIVSDLHTFGTDALLLADFAAPKKREAVCDLGTGCGIIPFYWLSHGIEQVTAVELQHAACDQLRRSVTLSEIDDRLTLYEEDILSLKTVLPSGRFSLITMNPPYTPVGKGIKSSSAADKIARHETALTLDGLFDISAYLLKFGGKISVCLRPERLTEAMISMRKAKIEPKRLRFVAQRPGKAPWLFLLEGKSGRNPGLKVEPEFYIENADGSLSDGMRLILGKYADTAAGEII